MRPSPSGPRQSRDDNRDAGHSVARYSRMRFSADYSLCDAILLRDCGKQCFVELERRAPACTFSSIFRPLNPKVVLPPRVSELSLILGFLDRRNSQNPATARRRRPTRRSESGAGSPDTSTGGRVAKRAALHQKGAGESWRPKGAARRTIRRRSGNDPRVGGNGQGRYAETRRRSSRHRESKYDIPG